MTTFRTLHGVVSDPLLVHPLTVDQPVPFLHLLATQRFVSLSVAPETVELSALAEDREFLAHLVLDAIVGTLLSETVADVTTAYRVVTTHPHSIQFAILFSEGADEPWQDGGALTGWSLHAPEEHLALSELLSDVSLPTGLTVVVVTEPR